tara:strand:- start:229853 stop:230683 length:831 start_codon:yes stop_codon:yes gene_type:complete
MNEFYVKKSNGTLQPFSVEKLESSLKFTGADDETISLILKEVEAIAHDGISTDSIYNLAFEKLRQISRPISAYYGTKRSLLELGPDGFFFEKYIARILTHLGYQTKIGVIIEGRCIGHEIDVLAESEKKNILIECKFHNLADKNNDIKTALYVKARANDISEGDYGENFDEFWLVSNTSFSDDAIRYSTCAGLHLLGSNFPPQNTLQDMIRDNGLDSLTCLSSLRKREKRMLLESDIFLTLEIKNKTDLLKDIGLESTRIKKVVAEINKLENRRKN